MSPVVIAADIIGSCVVTVPVAVVKAVVEAGSGNNGAAVPAAVIAPSTVDSCVKIEPVIFTPIFDGGAIAPLGIRAVCIAVIDVTADDKAVTAPATAAG